MQELPNKKAVTHTHTAAEGGGSGGGSTPGMVIIHEIDSRVDQIAGHMTQVLHLLNLDVDDPSISETPRRVAKMLLSFRQDFDPAALLKVFHTAQEDSGIVAQTGIPFQMLCEHHLLPAVGIANIAYLPNNGKVVGLSKLARLVKAVGNERPGLQESIGQRIADLIHKHLETKGVMVQIVAEHTCMTCRGAHAPGVKTITSVVKGLFLHVPHARQEVFEMWKLGR